jgi:hypothetical protein
MEFPLETLIVRQYEKKSFTYVTPDLEIVAIHSYDENMIL